MAHPLIEIYECTPGDVVMCVEAKTDYFTTGKCYNLLEIGGDTYISDDERDPVCNIYSTFTLIRRADGTYANGWGKREAACCGQPCPEYLDHAVLPDGTEVTRVKPDATPSDLTPGPLPEGCEGETFHRVTGVKPQVFEGHWDMWESDLYRAPAHPTTGGEHNCRVTIPRNPDGTPDKSAPVKWEWT